MHQGGVHSQVRRYLVQLAVVRRRVLIRKVIGPLLAGSVTWSDVIESGSVLELSCAGDRTQSPILIIHTTDVGSGIASARELRNLLPEARALMLVDDPDEDFAMQTLEAGA